MAGALVTGSGPRRWRGFAVVLTLLGGVAGCDLGGPVTVWVLSDTTELRPEDAPRLESRVFSAERRQVVLRSPINAHAAFQVALAARDLPATVDVSLSDFRGPAGVLAADELIERFRVGRVPVAEYPAWYVSHTGRNATPREFFDPLVPWKAPRGGGPIALRPGTTEAVWIDIRIPPTAEPGAYAAKLRVRSTAFDQRVLYEADVLLDVVPVALPTRPTFAVIERVEPRALAAQHLGEAPGHAGPLPVLRDDPAQAALVRLLDATMALLHADGGNPILWGGFPRFELQPDGNVAVEWERYVELVGGWIDGSAYQDRVAARYWPLPAAVDWPSAPLHGGIASPRYARVLGGYLKRCAAEFAADGYPGVAFVRLLPAGAQSAARVADARLLSEIVAVRENVPPFVAHLPPASLAGLGWVDAPETSGVQAETWAPPSDAFEPAAMAERQQRGAEAWFLPSQPPYSGVLTVGTGPTDARILPWQAFVYGVPAMWVEDVSTGNARGVDQPLIYAGQAYGLAETPVGSIRLKRLRTGIQDHALLTLLARRGQRALAERIARELVRYAFTDVARENLLSTLPAGWPRDGSVFDLAREVVLAELVGGGTAEQSRVGPELAARWELLLQDRGNVQASIRGVRLAADGTQVLIFTELVNVGRRAIAGEWTFGPLPPGWERPTPTAVTLAAGGRRQAVLEVPLSGLAYGRRGVVPLTVRFEQDNGATATLTTRLAITSALALEEPLALDGDLADWPLNPNNAAGLFLLNVPESVRADRAPTHATQAFFAHDETHLYLAVRCELPPFPPPQYATDNQVPIAGGQPWGQEVVEVLLAPGDQVAGTAGNLFQLQIKPNGVVRATQGCRTEPPIAVTTPWSAGIQVAAQRDRDAWRLEVAIPLEALGPAARRSAVWGVNVTRLDARRGEYSSWAGHGGLLYAPEALGNLLLLGR
jgi:hypothetical protein